MNRAQILALAGVILLAALVIVLALRGRQPPRLPADLAHASFVGAGACLTCHGPSGPLPQSRNHPVGQDCLRCHGLPRH